jgi:predicted nucleic acid-binding Zn ribbon protein
MAERGPGGQDRDRSHSGSQRRQSGRPADRPSGRVVRRYDGREEEDEALRQKLGNTPGPAPLVEPLERLVNNLGAPPISILSQLEDRWPDIVGPALAGPTRPVELIDGVLTIACEDAAWAAQLGWMEAQIKQRFADTFGSSLVQRVSTRIDH